jgi:hypothetical protein
MPGRWQIDQYGQQQQQQGNNSDASH